MMHRKGEHLPRSPLSDQVRNARDGRRHHGDGCENDESFVGSRMPSECKGESGQNRKVKNFRLGNGRETEDRVSGTREAVQLIRLRPSRRRTP